MLVALLIVPVAVRRRFLRLWQWLLALPTDKAPVVLVTMPTTQEVGSGVVWAKASDSVLHRHLGSACRVSAVVVLEGREQWLVAPPYSRHPPCVGSADVFRSGDTPE